MGSSDKQNLLIESAPPYEEVIKTAPKPIGQNPTDMTSTTVPAVGLERLLITCSHCHERVLTDLQYQPTMCTHIAVLLLCLFCTPLFWVPCCMDSCQSANHYCPKCGNIIGTYEN